MPRKTLYVKDADLDIWKRAQEELGKNISSIVTDSLRERLAARDQYKPGKPQKIRLDVGDAVIKSFFGEWLVGDENGGFVPDDDQSPSRWDPKSEWSIASTAKGNFLVFIHYPMNAPDMKVYKSFEELEADKDQAGIPCVPPNIVSAVALKLGIEYDIPMDI